MATATKVETRRENGRTLPALNVKCRNWPDVSAAFPGVEAAILERAETWAWNSAVRQFWDLAQQEARTIYSDSAKVFSAGRSGGWLVVDGVGVPEDWDAADRERWDLFEHNVRDTMAALMDRAAWIEDIHMNRWAEPLAEEFNFIDRNGETVCLADVPRCPHCDRRS